MSLVSVNDTSSKIDPEVILLRCFASYDTAFINDPGQSGREDANRTFFAQCSADEHRQKPSPTSTYVQFGLKRFSRPHGPLAKVTGVVAGVDGLPHRDI